jgi:DNA-binding sugar fermentation-stimulating protein
MFIAALPGIDAFKPNQPADPELYKSLIEVYEVGVEIRAISIA